MNMDHVKVETIGRLKRTGALTRYWGPDPDQEHHYRFEDMFSGSCFTLSDFVFVQRNFEFEDLKVGDILSDDKLKYTVVYIDQYQAFLVCDDNHRVIVPNSYGINCYQRVSQ